MPIQLPSGPRAQLLMTRILRLVDESGMADQWAALHLLNIAFHQSRRSKFPDFDFRRVFEIIWMTEKKKSGEMDTIDEAIEAWRVTREADFETMTAQLARALVVEANWGKIAREDVHAAIDQLFDAVEKPPGEGEPSA
ncbi:MAG: hypothetical protein ACYDCL_10620 [Myxococcales bacterium]